MSDTNSKPERCWEEIAADAAQELSPERLLELSQELEHALDQRKKILRATNKPAQPVLKKKSG
jgi:hypothetical protein